MLRGLQSVWFGDILLDGLKPGLLSEDLCDEVRASHWKKCLLGWRRSPNPQAWLSRRL